MMWKRVKQAWLVLRGKLFVFPIPKTIYVYNAGPDNKFVQLMPWRDSILALDNSGKIWTLDAEYPGSNFVCQLSMESPRSY